VDEGRKRVIGIMAAILTAMHFDATPFDDDWEPRYNIAPSQSVPVIRQTADSTRKLSLLRWGLIPSWATDPSIGFRTINARSETIVVTPSFRDPFRTQRCLIPADGFYEWRRSGRAKQPFCFEVGDGEMFAFAGLWDRWTDPRGKEVESCTIITTRPNVHLTDIHDRMPVILPSGAYASWLNPAMRDASVALAWLAPFAGAMRRLPVSTRVNLVENDDRECAKAVELEAPPQRSLFADHDGV
jgi:putative SOS response-associated peptidase YedK